MAKDEKKETPRPEAKSKGGNEGFGAPIPWWMLGAD